VAKFSFLKQLLPKAYRAIKPSKYGPGKPDSVFLKVGGGNFG
jgi:hypothetical protein